MNEKTGTSVNTEKEKVKESQSRSMTLSLDTPSGVSGWGLHSFHNPHVIVVFPSLKSISLCKRIDLERPCDVRFIDIEGIMVGSL